MCVNPFFYNYLADISDVLDWFESKNSIGESLICEEKKSKKICQKKKVFSQQIEEIVKDLYYISETDSEIFPFAGEQATESFGGNNFAAAWQKGFSRGKKL